jgi:hypothetical protein
VLAGALVVLAACSNEPPSWPRLIEGRILNQYPAAQVSRAGEDLVVVQGARSSRVELAPIILQCNRSHADCERALADMLLALGAPAR